jgi:hypothetical protein
MNGTIRITRQIWWYGRDPSDRRVDGWLGIVDDSLSVGARELCCCVGVDTSFDKARDKLAKLAQIEVSSERLRVIVEREGLRMLELRRQGLLNPAWRAEDCRRQPQAPSQILVGGDGVMVPVVTAAEKAKRRAGRKHVRRRGRRRCGQVRHRGADQGWKEFKIGQFYDAEKAHCHVFATRGDHQEFGRQLRREAVKIGLHRADQKLSITDGAEWLRRQLRLRLPMLDELILDFYHFAEHVGVAATACWGVDTPEAKSWTGTVLHSAKHDGVLAVLKAITAARGLFRARAKRTALAKLEQYVAKRVEMMDYPRFLAAGYDIGSGPTEAKCKTVPARLKGSGMRWNLPNAEAMAALACVEQSNLLQAYWNQERQRVA